MTATRTCEMPSLRNLPIAEPFQKAQREDFRLPRLQLRHGSSHGLP